MRAVAPAMAGLGVKLAVRVVPVPLIVPSVPPLICRSLTVKLDPGSKVKLKLSVAISPILSVLRSLVIVTAGVTVVTCSAGVKPAPPSLPAASV